MEEGRLFLIPVMLGDSDPGLTLPSSVFSAVRGLDTFIVEDEKSARHVLKKINPEISFPDITLYPLNEHTKPEEYSGYLDQIKHGKDLGLLSEAGCPCVADPGAQIVRIAQRKKIKVIPLTGPSSITLSLMASGFSGQNFVFHGYLPAEKSARAVKIIELEKAASATGFTQIFIETPYRNEQMLSDICAKCRDTTMLCVAADITSPNETIITQSVKDWRKKTAVYNKRPAVFLIGR